VEEDDEMTSNYWATAPEDAGPIIDKILDHRPKDGLGKDSQWCHVLASANG
jgi:chromodomain-helicase-DNA-binding protein 1